MSDFVLFFFWDTYFMNPANKVSLKEMQTDAELSVPVGKVHVVLKGQVHG